MRMLCPWSTALVVAALLSIALVTAPPASAQNPFEGGPKPVTFLESSAGQDASALLASATPMPFPLDSVYVEGILTGNRDVDCYLIENPTPWQTPVVFVFRVNDGRFTPSEFFDPAQILAFTGGRVERGRNSANENRPLLVIRYDPGDDFWLCAGQRETNALADLSGALVTNPTQDEGVNTPYQIELVRTIPVNGATYQELPEVSASCEDELSVVVESDTRLLRMRYDEDAPNLITVNGFRKSFAAGETMKVLANKSADAVAMIDGDTLMTGFREDLRDPVWNGLPGDPDEDSGTWGARLDGDTVRRELVGLGYPADSEVSVFVGVILV
ncbi:MAG: hypothetical protein AAFR95_18565, partial [Bacteroidota bacterium]